MAVNHPKLFDKFFAMKHYIWKRAKIRSEPVWLMRLAIRTGPRRLPDDKRDDPCRAGGRCNYDDGLHNLNETDFRVDFLFVFAG